MPPHRAHVPSPTFTCPLLNCDSEVGGWGSTWSKPLIPGSWLSQASNSSSRLQRQETSAPRPGGRGSGSLFYL